MPDANDWLDIDDRTLFRLHPDRRTERKNDPDYSPGSRFWFGLTLPGMTLGVA
ncbi:hypothetical protein [Burkholderia sp. LMG 21824]|uniref:hypothetical protein n=1 Tax=Burkholderia sp. LMG 21824 TaxID=3158172 RepID=UPI003C2C57BE